MNLSDKNSFVKNMLLYFFQPLTTSYLTTYNEKIDKLCIKNNEYYSNDNSLSFKYLNKCYGRDANKYRFCKKILHKSLIKEFNEISSFDIKCFEQNYINTLYSLLKNNKSYQILFNIPYDLITYLFQNSIISSEQDKIIFLKNWFNLIIDTNNYDFNLRFNNIFERQNFDKFIKNLYYFHSYNLLTN